jgi:hypothetical protein
LNELLGHNVTDLQPPLSGLAWLATIQVADFFGGSELAQLSLLLLVQAAIFWAAAVCFALEFRHRWIGALLMSALLLLTPLLVYSGNIGKDGQMMVAMLLAVLATHVAARRRTYPPLVLAILPLFYAFAVRSNGPLAVLPLCYYWSWTLVETVHARRAARRGAPASTISTGWRPRVVWATAGTALFAMLIASTLGLMSAVVNRPCCLGTPGTLTLVHDLMGMSVRVGKVLVPPYIIATPSYSVADIERAYYPPDNVNFNGLVSILPPATQRRVIGDWLVAVRTYPLAYLEHRLDLLGYFLGVTRAPNRYALFIGSNAGEYSWVVDRGRRLVGGMKDIPPQFDAIKGHLFSYFVLMQDTLLFRAFAYMAVFAAAFACLGSRRRGVLTLTADYAGLSAAIYFLSHFVLTSSASFRYIAWPVLAVPIVVCCRLDETMSASDDWKGRPLWRRPPVQFVTVAIALIGAIEVLRHTFG